MCPRGLLCQPAVTLTKKLKYEKRLLLIGKHHFDSDVIINKDHKRISSTEPSSVILSQGKYFNKKLKSDAQKMSKQAKVTRDGEINP